MADITLGQVFLLLLGAAGFWTFLGKLFDAWLDKRKRKRDKTDKDKEQNELLEKMDERISVLETDVKAIKRNEKLTSYTEFERRSKRAIEEGSVSLKDLEVLTEYYNAYHDLGGNGWATGLFERINELPVNKVDQREKSALRGE